MTNRKKVYCKYKFWEEFVRNQPSLNEVNDRCISQMQCWLNFFAFMSKSDLVFDITFEDYKHYCTNDSWLKGLWKKSASGSCGLEFKESYMQIERIDSTNISEKDMSAIFLVDSEPSYCLKKSNDLGVIILNPEMTRNIPHVFKDNGFALPNDNIRGWDYITTLESSYPSQRICNSMIIVDNYILKNNENVTRENLLTLLDCLLPKQLTKELTFDLYIIGRIDDRDKDRCKSLSEKIKQLRDNYNIRVAIFCSRDDFHDRAIITNNMWISCGHGFDIFRNRRVNQPTDVSVLFPYIQNVNDFTESNYFNLVKIVSTIERRNHRYEYDYWGVKDFNNHILKNFDIDVKKNQCIKSRDINFSEISTPPLSTPKYSDGLPGLKIFGKIEL